MVQTEAVRTHGDDRRALTKMTMQLFDHWKLSSEDQLSLLGLSTDNRAALKRYREGSSFANSRDLLERVGHLLAIHKNLRLLFPKNREIAYGWMATRNRSFDGLAPVDVISEYGFRGLLMVRAYLDHQRGG